jgi:hypothetical protein
MTPMLALQTWMTVAIVLAAISALTLLLIIIGPTRTVREEPPLDDDVETRILLGEDAAQIEEELEEEEQREEPEADTPQRGLPGPAA